MKRRLGIAALAVVALVALVGVAWARPGGGNSYSGGGGHGGGSSGGGGGGGAALLELIFHLLRLLFAVPQIGIPVLLLVVGYFIWSAYQQHQNRDWNSGPAAPLARAASLDDLRSLDPDFSQAAFEDFAFRLYATAQGARGRPGALDELAPYLSAEARAQLAGRSPPDQPVTGVVIGALRIDQVIVPSAAAIADGGAMVTIGLELEANYSVGAGAGSKRFAVELSLIHISEPTRPY